MVKHAGFWAPVPEILTALQGSGERISGDPGSNPGGAITIFISVGSVLKNQSQERFKLLSIISNLRLRSKGCRGKMTYEKGFGEIWQGLLADGTLDMELLAKRHSEHYEYEMKYPPHTAIVDMITATRKKRWDKEPPSDLHVCTPSLDIVRQRVVCETYVLSANSKGFCPLISELVNAHTEPNRFVILTLSNCKDMEGCTKDVLGELGFAERPKKAYRNYRRFSNAARRLIEDSVAYFEAPCVRLFEYLEHQGFSGDHETY